jgi:hypothetical protein
MISQREAAPRGMNIAAGILSAISLAYAGHCLWLGLSLANPMPLGDQWGFVYEYFDYLDGHYSWVDLFSQHNEHRLATTRIVLFADAILFGMRGLFLVVVNYASLAAIAAIGACVVGSRSNVERFTCFAVALGLLWSSAQWLNFIWQFQIQFAFVHLFALTCLVALGAPTDQNSFSGSRSRWPRTRFACFRSAAAFSLSCRP